MAINIFIYSLLIVSIVSLFATVSKKEESLKGVEKPQIVFEKSTLYTLNDKNIERIVNSSSAQRFKDRDLMYDGKIILRTNKNTTDYIESDIIIKRNDDYKFLNNVKYNRENNILLNTDELFYNTKTKIAQNSKPFDGSYFEHKVKGTHLFLDNNKNLIKSKNTHFEIDINN